MTKATVLAVLAIVWTLGFGIAAALTYDVTRPPTVTSQHP
jgi:hypothetical protein